MTEIKHKITNLLKSIEAGNVQYKNLEETLNYILNNNVSKNDAFSFLDLMHLSSISKTIASHDSNQWAMKIAQVIEKHNFHTGQLLLQREKRYKDKIAIHTIDGDKKIDITYTKLWNDVLKTSLAIKNACDNQKATIGILSHNQYKSAVVDLACLSSGFRIIPIPLNATREHLVFIIKEANITHLFLGGEKALQLWNSTKYDDDELVIIDVNDIGLLQNKSISWEMFHDKFFLNQKYDNLNELSDQDMNSTITIMYTSGSTSNPKGVKFSQLNIISKRFSRALALPEISNEDKFLCYLPLFHTFGRYFELMGSIFWGATYTFAESPSFNSLLKDFKIISPTIFISIPKRWVQIYELMNNSLDLDLSTKEEINTKLNDITGSSLKWGLSAAGYLDPDIFKFFHDNKINLMSGYGMTEATGGITMTPPNEYVEDTVGRALPGIRLRIEKDGELCMKGPYISNGFYKDDDSKSFKDGWFYSGDIFKEENGYYFIIDRKKDIYKNSRGQTIAPQKIENLFQDFDLVKSVFLVGDGKEYNTVLIYPNKENIDFNLQNMNESQVQNIFSAMLISINGFLSPFERIVNFAIINRDFSNHRNELTQKGTYKRKNILQNFDLEIDSMYKKDYVSLYNSDKEIKFPNWLIREIGTIKSNIKWNGNEIIIADKNIMLTFRWYENKIHIGELSYDIEKQTFDLALFINTPKLWLGNQEFVVFCANTTFRVKESINYNEITLIIDSESFYDSEQNITVKENDLQLSMLHKSILLYRNNNISFSSHLDEVIKIKNSEWSDVIVETFMQYLEHPKPIFRLKLLETICPLLSERFFVDQLRSIHRYHIVNKEKGFIFDVKKINSKQFHELINLLKIIHSKIDEIDTVDMNFIQKALSIVCEYGKIHPTEFILARSELIWWQLSESPSQVQSSAQKEYYNLINGFRLWIGPNSSITIDRETREEYTWSDVLTFDDNVSNIHKIVLLKAISTTALIKESIFLFSNDTILQLSDIPRNGIWIKHLTTNNHKSSFRILVKTISYGTYNIVLNLNQDEEKDFFEEEIKWLILMGSTSSGLNQLVEKFGGYWPEESIYTEEYITNDTVNIQLNRFKEEISSNSKKDRWQMRWLHYIWNGAQAYIDFWHRTQYKLAIYPPIPDNLIIPPHDYNTGNKIISISDRKEVESIGKFYLDLYIHYILDTEKRYPGLKHMADWELIFTATLEAMKVKKGIPILKRLRDDLSTKEIKNELSKLGLTVSRINNFLTDFNNFGVLTKPVVFASLRYERWLDLNSNATNEAKASILKELYHDYNLNTLLDEYPETRVRFFMMTCLKNSGDRLNTYFQSIIKDMRRESLSPLNLKDKIEDILLNTNLKEDEKFFLARMLYPHIDAADYVELAKIRKGDKKNIDLAFKTEDSEGNIYTIRPPFQPKEIAKFQTIISKENLSVTFNVNHDFLFLVNSRNKVIGGLYYKVKSNLRVHLEWVVIMNKYQQRNLSKKLMNDFFNRMIQNGHNIITVGFYHESFFYKQGFKIDQSFGGLVKKL